jgi:Family of unknown function (DUF6279)
MMITFTAMRFFSVGFRALIIGAATVLLMACSAVRLGYDNGPSLALWWLDGYLDLNRQQEARVKPLLEDWFAWHRTTQLPDYAQLLAGWKQRAMGQVTGDEVCRIGEQVSERLTTAVERALPQAADLLPAMEPAQWRALERKYAERNAELRRDYAQADPVARREAALDRAIGRAEEFYGTLNAAQKKLLAEAIAAQPMSSEDWIAAREQRQRDQIQALKRAQQEADPARRGALLREALLRGTQPADERQARWQAQGCELSARMHNSTTPRQRQHLRDRLDAWEEDLRALAAAGAG